MHFVGRGANHYITATRLAGSSDAVGECRYELRLSQGRRDHRHKWRSALREPHVRLGQVALRFQQTRYLYRTQARQRIGGRIDVQQTQELVRHSGCRG
jgi:hypothetical protein